MGSYYKYQQEQRQNMLRRRRRSTAILLMFLVIIGSLVCAFMFCKAEDVVVEGDLTMYTAEQIVECIDIQKGVSLFDIDRIANEQKIRQALPYIEKVSIGRSLPSTVIISVAETECFGAIPYKGGYVLVSDSMRIVGDDKEVNPSLTLIYGIQPTSFEIGSKLKTDNEDSLTYLVEMKNAFYEAGISDRITSINTSDKLELYAVIDGRILAEFGTANQLDYKIRMLIEVVDSRLSAEDTGVIDLSTAGKATYLQGEINYPKGYFAKSVKEK